jgi:hypothetical protein
MFLVPINISNFIFCLSNFLGLNMQMVPALKGRLIFSPYISKTFQICPTLSVNFKKGPSLNFFDDVSQFLIGVTNE